MDGRSTLLSPSPVPEPAAEERDGGVRGDGRGDADGFFFLPLERGIAARGGLKGRDGTAASREPKTLDARREEGGPGESGSALGPK